MKSQFIASEKKILDSNKIQLTKTKYYSKTGKNYETVK